MLYLANIFAVDPARRAELLQAIADASTQLEYCEQEAATLAEQDRELKKVQNEYKEKHVCRRPYLVACTSLNVLIGCPSSPPPKDRRPQQEDLGHEGETLCV